MNLLLSTGAIVAIAVVAVLVLLVVILVCWGIGARNNFVRMRSNYEEAFATIDV